MSETFLKLHPKGYHIFKEGSLKYCAISIKVEVPILHTCPATEGGNDLDANLFNSMPTWKEYVSFFKNFLTGDFDNYDFTGHELNVSAKNLFWLFSYGVLTSSLLHSFSVAKETNKTQ